VPVAHRRLHLRFRKPARLRGRKRSPALKLKESRHHELKTAVRIIARFRKIEIEFNYIALPLRIGRINRVSSSMTLKIDHVSSLLTNQRIDCRTKCVHQRNASSLQIVYALLD
jgi:hypothetical protein